MGREWTDTDTDADADADIQIRLGQKWKSENGKWKTKIESNGGRVRSATIIAVTQQFS